MRQSLIIHPGKLTLADLDLVNREPVTLSISPDAYANMERSVATVNAVIAENRVVYGINTGFGLLANTRIKPEELETLQRSIVLSHAAGIGKFMSEATVRLLMVLKMFM